MWISNPFPSATKPIQPQISGKSLKLVLLEKRGLSLTEQYDGKLYKIGY